LAMSEKWLNQFIHGDALDYLRSLPDESVDFGLTSPPYWGLRDYGTGLWRGGEETCEHRVGGQRTDQKAVYHNDEGIRPGLDNNVCKICGAERIDRQIGLEATVEAYIEALVVIFREFRRVLTPTGTLWLNMGDVYATTPNGASAKVIREQGQDDRGFRDKPINTIAGGLKAKDLAGLAWTLALALRDDGWVLRQEIIWHKKNPMPESVRDRPTRAHEQIFLFSKSNKKKLWLNAHRGQAINEQPAHDHYWVNGKLEVISPNPPQSLTALLGEYTYVEDDWKRFNHWQGRDYYYDDYALRASALNAGKKVRLGEKSMSKRQTDGSGRPRSGNAKNDEYKAPPSRNARTVWEIEDMSAWFYYAQLVEEVVGRGAALALAEAAFGTSLGVSVWKLATEPMRDAHFATFPTELVKRCLIAGCPPLVCSVCGIPHVRLVERDRPGWIEGEFTPYAGKMTTEDAPDSQSRMIQNVKRARDGGGRHDNPFPGYIDKGFHAACDCVAPARRGIALDMFAGAGTVAVVAEREGRDWTGGELNEQYIQIADNRLVSERFEREQSDPYAPTLVFEEDGEQSGYEQLPMFAGKD